MSVVVNIRMKDETFQLANNLQEALHSPSKSDVIRRAIELSNAVATSIADGGRIIIENRDGSKNRLIIPGLTNQ